MALPFSYVLIALAAVLVAYAGQTLWVRPLAALLSRIPALGADVAQAVVDAWEGITESALAWAQEAIGGLTELIAVPISAFRQYLDSLAITLATFTASLVGAGSGLLNRVNELASDAANTVLMVVQALAAIAGLSAAFAGLNGWLHSIETAVIPAAQAQAIAAANEFAAQQAEAARAAGVGAAAVAAAEAAANLADERARGMGAEAALWRAIPGTSAEDAEELARQAATAAATAIADLAQETDRARRAERDIADAITRATTAAVLPLATEISTMRRTCVDPMCAMLGPLTGLVDGLFDVLVLAEVFALVSDAIHDPQGSAAVMASESGGLRSLAAGITGPFLGIAA